jgi:hypothetical protein
MSCRPGSTRAATAALEKLTAFQSETQNVTLVADVTLGLVLSVLGIRVLEQLVQTRREFGRVFWVTWHGVVSKTAISTTFREIGRRQKTASQTRTPVSPTTGLRHSTADCNTAHE